MELVIHLRCMALPLTGVMMCNIIALRILTNILMIVPSLNWQVCKVVYQHVWAQQCVTQAITSLSNQNAGNYC